MNLRMSVLGLVVVPLIVNGRVAGAADGGNTTSTVYVGRHFEVRDHDQPVKYLFHGDERVARVTGSLSNRERIQRLRLQPGWNLISLAVTATNYLGQLAQFTEGPVPLVSVLYRWRPVARDFVGVSVGQSVEAGTVLWLRTETNALVSVVGEYAEPSPAVLAAGGGYVASAGLEDWHPQLPPGVTTWKYDALAAAWRATFTGDLEAMGEVPPTLAPGDAVFIHTAEAIELAAPERAGRVLFYHADHLGSAAAITDAMGASAEEAAYYPFGEARHRHRSRDVEAHYGFTQKEQDRESGLHYFEARYVVSPLGRFPSFDPLLQNLEALEAGELNKILVEPARLNPFAYALNNPTRYVDPDGRESREVRPRPRARTTQPQPRQPAQPARATQSARPRELGPKLTLRLGPPSKTKDELPASSFSISPRRDLGSPSSGAGREQPTPAFTEIQVSRIADDASTSLFLAQQQGVGFESVELIVPGGEGKEVRLHLENVLITSVSMSGHGGESGEAFETLTFNAAKMRFGDPAPPTPNRESGAQWDLRSGRGQ